MTGENKTLDSDKRTEVTNQSGEDIKKREEAG